nr:MAG TPA: protein of unknown function (DUF1922) [Caudoviricetes sp.]
MSKYQLALDNFVKDTCKSGNCCRECDIEYMCNCETRWHIDVLQELVDRATPIKPAIWGDGYDDEGNLIYDMYDCPNCGKTYEIDYDDYKCCPNCGQVIDWSDNNILPDDVDEQSAKGSLRELEFQIKNAINYGHSDIYLEVESAKRILDMIKKNIGEE